MNLRSRRPTVICLLAIAVSGCRNDGGADDPDAASTRISSAPEWIVEPAGLIGSLDDPDQALTRVGHVVIGPEEELYITQPMDGNIRVYGSGGALKATIGRKGEGPGEFGMPAYIGLKGDTLYVSDNHLGRVSFFSRSGQFLRSQQWATTMRSERSETGVSMFYEGTVPQVFLPDGTALLEVSAFEYWSPRERDEPILSLGEWARPFLRVDAQGQAIDTISQERTEKRLFGVTSNAVTSYYRIPFRDTPLASVMRDGSGVVVVDRTIAASTDDATFGVTLVGPMRDTVFSRTFAYEARPVPDNLVERMAEEIHLSEDPGPSSAAIEGALRANDLIPPTLTPVTALTVGQDGSIWIRREESVGDSALWNVLDAEGELRGAVQLPAGDSVIAARGDVLVAVYSDELDVPYIVRYRLVR